MRLTCPACAAQYEIDANLIPAAGRMVQCDACAHRWIAQPATAMAPEDLEHQADLPRPSGLNPHVARILREEAEAERQLSQAQSDAADQDPAPTEGLLPPVSTIETAEKPDKPQPLAAPPPRPEQTKTMPASAAAFGTRPMDDVIAARSEDAPSGDPVLTGLLGIVALLLLAALIYSEADAIAAHAPALDNAVHGFASTVDAVASSIKR